VQPSCRAIYDFEAENAAELSFKENDIILLKSQVDENWFEGTVHGRTGYFPVSYVTVLIPLPKI
jgi:endophilin-A